jgi:hypothetical protein
MPLSEYSTMWYSATWGTESHDTMMLGDASHNDYEYERKVM